MNDTMSAAGGLLSRHLLRQYKIGYLHMRAFASDFSDEEARKAPSGHLPLVWYIAHLMCAHDHFLKLYVGHDGGLTDSFVQRYAGKTTVLSPGVKALDRSAAVSVCRRSAEK